MSDVLSQAEIAAAMTEVVDGAEAMAIAALEAGLAARLSAGRSQAFLSVDPHEREVKSVRMSSALTRGKVAEWSRRLVSSGLKVGRPRVLKARGLYADSTSVLFEGLYVAVDVVVLFGQKAKVRVFDLSEVAGWPHRNVKVPRLGLDFYLNPKEEDLLVGNRRLHSSIQHYTNPLVAGVAEALAKAERAAPDLVREYRAPRLRGEEALVAEKLAPFLAGNPLAGLPPPALALILKSPWQEIERLVTFVKGNRVIAGGVTEESMKSILRLIVAHEVMNS